MLLLCYQHSTNDSTRVSLALQYYRYSALEGEQVRQVTAVFYKVRQNMTTIKEPDQNKTQNKEMELFKLLLFLKGLKLHDIQKHTFL